VTVYNLQVEDSYTYHVGKTEILVHNADGYSGKKGSSVTENSAKGKAFETDAFGDIKATNPDAATQVRQLLIRQIKNSQDIHRMHWPLEVQ
jgi:hypothetical protein